MLKNYNAFRNEMILRDYLALDRTILAISYGTQHGAVNGGDACFHIPKLRSSSPNYNYPCRNTEEGKIRI